MAYFNYITPAIYLMLVLVWAYISFFYVKKLMLNNLHDKLLKTLLIILAIDALRTLLESTYFGVWFTSLSGLIPISYYNFLAQPQVVFFPKLMNLGVSFVILAILIRKWIPAETSRLDNLNRLIEEQTTELKQNISALAMAKDEIKESELRYRYMFENNPQPMWIYDLATLKFLEVNHAAVVHYGYGREEFLSMTLKDIRPDNDIEALLKDIKLTRKSYNSAGEWRHLKKNGELINVEIVSHSIVYGEIQARHVMVIDITNRKLAEEKLKDNYALLRIAGEKAKLGGWNVILKENRSYWSDEVAAIHEMPPGYSPQLDEGINFYAPEWRDKISQVFHNCAQQGISYDEEMEIITATGKRLWVRTVGEAVRDEDGNIYKVHGSFQDISSQKQAEQALKESEALYRTLVERLPDGIYKTTAEGRFVDVNPAMVTLLGYASKEELMAVDVNKQLYFDDERANVLNKDKMGVLDVYRLKKKDGSEIWVEDHGWYVKDDKGEVLYHEGVIRDVTQRKHAEDELIKLSGAVEQSPVSILITDINGHIEYVNAKALTLTGYTFEELKGKTPRIFSSGEKPKEEYSTLWETILSGKEWRGELHNKKKNGELYWEFASISAIKNKMGRITHFLAVKEDITERKQADKDLRELEIARKTARFKQNFLANMSHEIRTPLTGVLGMIDILELTQLNEDQQDYVNTIKASGENLKEIINQVLDYSKIEAGNIELNHLDFEFQSILQNAEMLYRNITRPGVKVLTHLDPAIPRFIKTDKSRLSQVINNLVSNALKFTHKGSVSVQARLLKEITEGKKVKIEIKVVDTGIGIPAHLQEKLFSPFSQIDDNDTRYYEGTGLGLSICKELVGLLGGEIGVESDSYNGSTFWFTFTAQIAESQLEPELLQHKYANHQSLHILLTEDKVVNQKVVSLMLKSLGHTVTIANNGAQALELYEPGKYDLILMDIQMPVMNGIKATQILKERFTDLPPVIGLSANAFEGDREKYMALGMDEYLAKPVKRDDFRKMLQHFFASDLEDGLS